ncbi:MULTISPECIES: MobC family plasmid mobilization relaxosome protein [Micrococcales]|uniref:MobC family plasmid mobilization relaxosome protein n=1 Tax=Micrococcales TaxID=85006 RepID=UPI00117A7CE6|nr:MULTISPECIES: MobC family plasmid mobilization relaxosome protein [Micrococcales]
MASNNPDTRPPSKGERLTVRFDEGELARVRRRALAMGVAPSALVRASVLDVVEGGVVPTAIAAAIADPEGVTADSPALRELRVEVNRIGVNFNQLVRKAHSDGATMLGSPTALAVLAQLTDVLRRVEDELGGTRRAA